ncbi:hypothetical protein FALCPG4_012005 [Fusarium falciforme]
MRYLQLMRSRRPSCLHPWPRPRTSSPRDLWFWREYTLHRTCYPVSPLAHLRLLERLLASSVLCTLLSVRDLIPPLLSATVLSDLRVFTGARVVYALTAAKVAGAISQTAFFDYRLCNDVKSHFGSPLTSVEVFLKDTGSHKTTDEKIEGDIVVRGPCVAGGEVNIGIPGKIRDDNTLAYA